MTFKSAVKAVGKAVSDSLTVVNRELEFDEFTRTVRVTETMRNGSTHRRVFVECHDPSH